MARSALTITLLGLGLTIFGLLMVGSSSVVDAARDFGDKWYYLKLQSGWAVMGLAGFFLISRWPYQKLEKLSVSLLLITLLLLVLVLIPGLGSKLLGARRWLSLGFFSFQPAELAKLTLAIYFSSLLKKATRFRPFIIVLGLTGLLIMLEPDLGTTLILTGSSLLTYFGSGGQLRYLGLIIPVFIIAAAALVFFSPYRLDRLKTFFDYSRDPLGSSYHIRQVLLSLGSGGVFGVGLGQSKQKYEFLPEATTDSIFAVIGEELGLVGGLVVIAAFLVFMRQGFLIAASAPDQFGANLVLALTSWISLQALVNLGAMVAIIPLTGVPLPFISYGGSSLVLVLLASGILVNIAKQK
ncbi:MAG: Cell division-specific peptidoglycan biosynthesis regulator FtsW [Candidatus Amesbacteria bacterium GW2011_GWA1_46_35]|uniref:Probable peptidoglycan glycosyltransferase FtsW n=1 Tax=Candidatus Amesbacteria bacterium GW2011_GWC2_45_19 TaxID=1618366 RepID=A0A0G1PCX1_9BACT|nr:MAG: Cell division-specific peptidoglycan biosynthesis regulator FtsW [Candidatus Amesbacteria bacterium GW2011_GWC2_45_19]KKU38600.1 MAG: Cell division-specific peptidoglycan biosynthesis regulator FtsW [Candidatus Amesbacteria bacterium GW2011_GWA1_46_35]KKU69445.1 MAG: Cell division-specific peptidoglycan biosynthesis regulator FtsW [Microgenomates group bacterium GW2011_GWC1_47_20]